jgi:hypothetical protein
VNLSRCLALALLALPVFSMAQSNKDIAGATLSDTPAPYVQALSALQKGDIDVAEKLLQQVVQLYPNWAGAWLDLSLIAYRKEQFAQSEEFLLILEQRFSPLPQGVQQAVQQLRSQLALHLKPSPTLSSDWTERLAQTMQHQTAVSLGAGYDNNVNAGLRFNTITLTLPDRNFELTLAPSSQAMSAAFVRAGVVHQTKVSFDNVDANFQIQMQTRQYEGLPQFGNLELVPQVSFERGPLPGVTTLGLQAISLNHVLTYKAPILRWQSVQALPLCALHHQLQAEQRQYVVSNYLNSSWFGYRPAVHCERADQKLVVYAQRAQENAASDARPGQNTRSQMLGLLHEWQSPLGMQGHKLQMRAEIQKSVDSAGYSYLLDSGNPRSLQNKLGWVNWSAPLNGQTDWRWNIALQSNRQSSNLAVFKQRNFSLESSIWRVW